MSCDDDEFKAAIQNYKDVYRKFYLSYNMNYGSSKEIQDAEKQVEGVIFKPIEDYLKEHGSTSSTEKDTDELDEISKLKSEYEKISNMSENDNIYLNAANQRKSLVSFRLRREQIMFYSLMGFSFIFMYVFYKQSRMSLLNVTPSII